jgi:tRNA (guanine26-N2/guanine27-N2)-dimethyltransferase
MISLYAQRNVERKWVTAKRKEIRKCLIDEKGDPRKEGSKEDRKKKTDELEREIEERVENERKEVDFVKMTKESGVNSSGANSEDSSGLTILEALAASGLRSLRYWKEIPGVRTMVVNDLDPVAIQLAKENVVRNGMQNSLADTRSKISDSINNQDDKQEQRPAGIVLQVGDATHEMYLSRLPPSLPPSQYNPSQLQQKPQYDVIDLDPYGSASPFLDAAVQSVKSGGLLAVTCTDMAALGGSHPETCYGRYAAFPVQRSGYLQELALRILLYQISVVAGRYGRSIRPVLSVGMAFYCRVFVEVYDNKAAVSQGFFFHTQWMISLTFIFLERSTICL